MLACGLLRLLLKLQPLLSESEHCVLGFISLDLFNELQVLDLALRVAYLLIELVFDECVFLLCGPLLLEHFFLLALELPQQKLAVLDPVEDGAEIEDAELDPLGKTELLI